MTEPTRKGFFNRYLCRAAYKQQSRLLTAGEIVLAQSVFGDSIRLDGVQLKTAWWVLKNYAVSPNGNIYFNPADWIADFSEASLSKQSWLIHELTHVWQLQQGLKVVRGALMDRRYNYVLETGKSFFKYGIEQQARMVQDYFLRHQRGQNCQDLEDCIPFLITENIRRRQL
ncbi:type IV secretion protein Rhs [Psychrobacter sp. NG254]|uniref:type IV secretion protein Rhs n=1 Tax=Psychrobacter sp. NG254 TaxID=2782003 RepID=UPI001887B53E|nr:type IV secretion protein Rhs [Psychrobacter sp. NG254]MBF2718959.1 type IV secretion protein Rhs [Psychrobacter sp. NG254]